MPNEAGIGALRVNFIREVIPGVTPTDPAWLRYSDELNTVGNWVPNTNIAARTAIGTPDVVGFSIGAEDHELAISYSLQRWLTSAVEQPLDALADGFLRDADGYIINTHSFLARQTLPAPEGSQASGVRIYTYGFGGKFDSASLTGDPSNSEPVMAEGSYRFSKVRSYEVSQPTATGTLTVVSTNAGDTTQTLTVEDEGAGATEAIALNGTTPVVAAVSFPDIDSFRLDLETLGDVIVTFTAGGEEAFRIMGSESQQDIEGDLGMALLGAGSFEPALATPFEHVLGDLVVRASEFPLDTNLMTLAVSIANNIQVDPVVSQKAKVLSEGLREVTANVTVFSATGSHAATIEHLKALTADLVWTMTGGTITLDNAVLTTPGARTYEKGEATMRRDNVFTGQGISITP
jgi:hypothetical protein